jgi:hypothetical protein
MRMSKASIVFVVSLALTVPAFGSPSESNDPGPSAIITRVLRQIKQFIIKVASEPTVPIPSNG